MLTVLLIGLAIIVGINVLLMLIGAFYLPLLRRNVKYFLGFNDSDELNKYLDLLDVEGNTFYVVGRSRTIPEGRHVDIMVCDRAITKYPLYRFLSGFIMYEQLYRSGTVQPTIYNGKKPYSP